jgi:dimeric dUTPase (all-alpha-NTP-PPase superfamily)
MEEIEVPVGKDALGEIFILQKLLVSHYIMIEGLPCYPLDLSQKKHQKVVKDFKERIVGELSEAYGEIMSLWISENDNKEYNKLAALRSFNEEIADVLHFFIELLIYSDIDAYAIEQFFHRQVRDNPDYKSLLKDSTWLTIFAFAQASNLMQGYSFSQVSSSSGAFMVADDYDLIKAKMFDCYGGRRISGQIMTTHSEFMWEITYMLNTAVSYLKHKDWAQSEKIANIMGYKENLMECFLHFIRYMDFIGQTPIGLYHAYVRKNKILQKRIKDGY